MVSHLFHGRYKAILCDRDAYLMELVRYIHLNPARLRIPRDLAGYRWSSHQTYLGGKGGCTALVFDNWGARHVKPEMLTGSLSKTGKGWVTNSVTTKRSIRDFWAMRNSFSRLRTERAGRRQTTPTEDTI
jgi:hypothetical protein